MEDYQIIELYFKRNADAIKETDSKYGSYCFTIAENILHNKEDSEECVNDTWFHAWNAYLLKDQLGFVCFLQKLLEISPLIVLMQNMPKSVVEGR